MDSTPAVSVGITFDDVTNDPTPRARRAARLLKDFYGSANSKDPGATSEKSIDLDSQSFDTSLYFQNVLKTNSLSDLIRTDNGMVSEIKKLDSDMKTLVYENYNKFISATETIRKVDTFECGVTFRCR
jgi:hypothetical protein